METSKELQAACDQVYEVFDRSIVVSVGIGLYYGKTAIMVYFKKGKPKKKLPEEFGGFPVVYYTNVGNIRPA